MFNKIYEEYYDKYFLSYYKENEVKCDNVEQSHSYSIPLEKREKLYHLDVYTIDPEGCSDADDAFSIAPDIVSGKLFLYIHIADPTEYICLSSSLWQQICLQKVSMYPSNRNPIHLMPEKILMLSSLQEKKYNSSLRNAITIKININKDTYDVMDEFEIFPSHIKVKNGNAYTYKEASLLCNYSNCFCQGLKIAKKLREKRGIYADRLSQINNSYPVYDNDNDLVMLKNDDNEELNMKQMIAEFAIISNNIVGKFITKNLKEKHNMYRSCDLSSENKIKLKDKNGQEMIEYIVNNGVKACYNSIKSKHDLVGKDRYIHFTSPLRRVSDCVCHYILKYILIKNNKNKTKFPFKKNFLTIISQDCDTKNKELKKMQYNDSKYRLIQAMDNILNRNISNNNSIIIHFKILSYSGIFLNIIVNRIENYPVYFIMVFRKKFLNINKLNELIKNKTVITLKIKTIFFYESNYDAGKFPELENFLYSSLS